MIRIVPIKFQHAGRHYDFNALNFELTKGTKVIVETDRGRALGTVVTAPREVADNEAPDGIKGILRIATEEDLALSATNAARERDALKFCHERIQSRRMDMKLVRAEYAFDGSKILFFFTADGRVDFRELVKDLAHHFHTRIEMRQIGVRDEAKMVGGLGICGRELCCCSFLTEFAPVSVKMAKEQGLALNPTKISGQCGRLLCCLGYEYETYVDLKRGMPKCGKKVTWQDQEWEVNNQLPLCRKITLRQPGGTCCTITMDEFESGKVAAPAAGADQADGEAGVPARPARPREGGRRDRRERQPSRPAKPTSPEQRTKAKPAGPAAAPAAAQKPATGGAPVEGQGAAPGAEGGQSKSKRRRRNRRRGGKRPGQEPKGE